MISRGVFCGFAAVLAFGFLTLLPGCDWLKSSGSSERTSPFLSSLSVSPSSVLCGADFTVSFRYDDPQGDMAKVRVTLLRSEDSELREESPLWPAEASKSSGLVSFPFSFTCGSKGGIWSVTVQAEDERGHTSNILSGEIRLNAAG